MDFEYNYYNNNVVATVTGKVHKGIYQVIIIIIVIVIDINIVIINIIVFNYCYCYLLLSIMRIF